MKRLFDFAFLAILSVIGAAPAYAYLDSGTISLALQVVTGAVASVLLFGRIYLARIASFFRRSPSAAPVQDKVED